MTDRSQLDDAAAAAEAAAKNRRRREKLDELHKALTPDQIRVYRQHFEMFDLNGDGVISARELRKVSRQMGYRLDDSQIEVIIKENDLDSNGCLSFDEFLLSMAANIKVLPEDEHRRAEVRRQFAEFDRDGDGVVTMDEAHSVLQRQLGFSAAQSVQMVKRYDVDGDGKLDYEEFVRFYAKVKAKLEKVRQMFDEFDRDKNGAVSVAEVGPSLRGLGFTDHEIEELVRQHDKNRDGELQYEEFVEFLWASSSTK